MSQQLLNIDMNAKIELFQKFFIFISFLNIFLMEEGKEQQQKLTKQQTEKLAQQDNQNNLITEEKAEKKELSSSLRQELLAMQFEPSLVDRVIEQTDDLQKAIQLIVSLLEQQDIKQISNNDDVKMVLLVRMDLKMGLGKIAAQCAHATLRAYHLARNRAQTNQQYSLTFIQWLQTGQEKVAYQVANEQQLFETLQKFEALGVGTCYIRDAGRTQIAAGSTTVGGICPWNGKKLEAVTRSLRRL